MAALGREVVNRLLLGPTSDGRLVHDSPIRGDVWANYAEKLGQPVDLLIEVHWDHPTGGVAARLTKRLYPLEGAADRKESAPEISYLEGFITARLILTQLAAAVLPYTAWASEMRRRRQKIDLNELQRIVAWQLAEMKGGDVDAPRPANIEPTVARMAATLRVLATLLWAHETLEPEEKISELAAFAPRIDVHAIARRARVSAETILWNRASLNRMVSDDIFSVSRNRPVELAVERSIPAVKADAVSTLFSISCANIGWAILDTGIDAAHPAFADRTSPIKKKKASRVKATYDFTRLRQIVLSDYLYNDALLGERAEQLASQVGRHLDEVKKDLKRLAEYAQDERPIDWATVERYIRIVDPRAPTNSHGTHVAGILGACWDEENIVTRRGVCPDIRLYDFRVVGADPDSTEFAVVGALQFIRYLNSRNNYPVIHGANISLSIRHDVRNYACGQTPVCSAARRAVESGVVVVVAAGNRGYQSYHLSNGDAFETYAPSSITDPGNAEAVITVGATHRSAPHTFGVSYFSSRGPTGDGRQKPDLVAPGEKIWSVIPGKGEDMLSGTSMAAPHVSGAAAMLMARNVEFVGRAAEIKNILCSTCTDLGRERSFQGAGMLDILRAMQRI